MKRRDFIKGTAVGGFTGIIGQGCSALKTTSKFSGPGFDVHPFIRNHPEAVFIHFTDIHSKRETGAIRDTGYKLSQELIVQKDLNPVSSMGY